MAKFYWLASYPKSGNTWMRILLTNYLQNSDEPADINKLRGAPIASDRVWFDEWVGVEASVLDDTTIERLRPGVYRCMAREEQEPLFTKVHDAWGCTDRSEGLFPADVTAGVIYIMRNPLDMATSCANHWGISIDESVERLCDPDSALARSLGGLSDQLRQYLGSWSSHVISWLDKADLPVHLVRYEDLRRDPQSFFGEVVRFCDLPWDKERIDRAVAFSDFSELQRQEKTNNFLERPTNALGQFFRRGQSGGWREELPANLVQRLIDVHGETMRRFGYLDENYQPV
jgi:aryl sulfotransferase